MSTLLEKIQLEPGEDMLETVRRHWFVIVTQLVWIAIIMVVPFAGFAILAFVPEATTIFEAHTEYQAAITFGFACWFLFTLLIGFHIWTHYFLDVLLITDHRVVVLDQRAFFNRKISSFRLERLQDIEVTIEGIIPTFLDYGTLHAQTASASETDFVLYELPRPRELQARIQAAMDRRMAELRQGTTDGVA